MWRTKRHLITLFHRNSNQCLLVSMLSLKYIVTVENKFEKRWLLYVWVVLYEIVLCRVRAVPGSPSESDNVFHKKMFTELTTSNSAVTCVNFIWIDQSADCPENFNFYPHEENPIFEKSTPEIWKTLFAPLTKIPGKIDIKCTMPETLKETIG